MRGSRLMSASFLGVSLSLAGCAGNEDVTASGSPFSQALFKNYTDLSTQAASAPAPQAEDTGFFSDLTGIFERTGKSSRRSGRCLPRQGQ